MTIPAHAAGGFLILQVIDKINPGFGLREPKILLAGVLGSILVDVDAFFYEELKDHHNSLLHTPLFWALVFILGHFWGSFTKNSSIINITFALSIGVFSHLFLDWFGARRSGIRIFYPFSERMYSLYPLDPGKWGSPWRLLPKREHLEFYLKNKFLFLTEVSIVLVGLYIWILERTKMLR